MTGRAPLPRRREWLASLGTATAAGLVLTGCRDRPDTSEPPVTAVEDLMREHGVIQRVLLVYDDALHRLDDNADVPLEALRDTAGLVRRFVEDYHERIEEEELFPLFEKAQRHGDLVATLVSQHRVGRELTAQIRASTLNTLDDGTRKDLARMLSAFVRLYRPHAAREDTVLFPALHAIIGANAYRELGERFDEREDRELGHEGFEHAITQIAKLEQTFGIDSLTLPNT
jgi:hemerythrin-like domain-containing protein